MTAVFRGTEQEALELVAAITTHCACDATPGRLCASHLLLDDQRAMNGLLLVRRHLVAKLYDEEHLGGGPRETIQALVGGD